MKIWPMIAAAMLAAPAASGQQSVTQAEWIAFLARYTGLQYHLSGPATVTRYIDILSRPGFIGIEAEKADFSTGLSPSRSLRYGEPSADVWLEAGTEGGLASYRFSIPNRREYLLEGIIRGGSQTWKLGDQTMEVPDTGKNDFTQVRTGEIVLDPGEHELSVVVPAEGGIDRIELITSGIPAISPAEGFEPQEYLRYRLKAETIIRAIDSFNLLPVSPGYYELLEGEKFREISGKYAVSEDESRGSLSEDAWLRSQTGGAHPSYRFNLPSNGIYLFKARLLGQGRIIADFNRGRTRFFFPADSPEHPSWVEVGTFYLPGGEHNLAFELPAGSGLDVIEITRLASKPEDFLTLLLLLGFPEGGLEAPGEPPAGEVFEAEAAESGPNPGFASRDTGDKDSGANGVVLSAIDAEKSLRIEISPRDSTHYALILRFQGHNPIPFLLQDRDGQILDQRLVFPGPEKELAWMPVIGNIPLDKEQTYTVSLKLPPGPTVDALKLIPAVFPWERLRDLLDQEVKREGADLNLLRMIRLYGDETEPTVLSPTEPEDEKEDDDDEEEFGPSSPYLPQGR